MGKRQAFQILFEDDDLIVVNKAPNVPVIPERKRGDIIPLIEQLKINVSPEIRLIHRIDKDTSGLVVFAKNLKSQQKLSESFQTREVDKTYLAIVSGRVTEEDWKILDYPIFKEENKLKVFIHRKGKASKTAFKTLENFSFSSLLEIKLMTGRTHQIRVHLSHYGYPLLVDPLYGSKEAFYLSEIKSKKYKSKKEAVERPLISRHTLHAAKICFDHPSSNKKLVFEADPPKDWKALLYQLRKSM